MPIASAQNLSPGRKTASGDFFCAGSARLAFSASKSKAALGKTPIATMKGVCAFPWEAYNYANQNPVMKVDPTGELPADVGGAGAIACSNVGLTPRLPADVCNLLLCEIATCRTKLFGWMDACKDVKAWEIAYDDMECDMYLGYKIGNPDDFETFGGMGPATDEPTNPRIGGSLDVFGDNRQKLIDLPPGVPESSDGLAERRRRTMGRAMDMSTSQTQ